MLDWICGRKIRFYHCFKGFTDFLVIFSSFLFLSSLVSFFFFHLQGVEAGLEEEKLQRERQETQWVSEAEARAQVLRIKSELKAQERQAVQLESSCKAVDRSLGQSSKKLQVTDLNAVCKLSMKTLLQNDVIITQLYQQALL